MINFYWFRRDLRLQDNHGLYEALSGHLPVICIFIFDEDILSDLRENKSAVDLRLVFIRRQLEQINKELGQYGSALKVLHGRPIELWKQLSDEFSISRVFVNEDYEPYAVQRDAAIAEMLKLRSVGWSAFKDQVIFEKKDVVKDDGEPYSVFTPYSKKWKLKLNQNDIPSFPSEHHLENLKPIDCAPIMSLEKLGFLDAGFSFPKSEINIDVLQHYSANRDYPGGDGTSRIGIHLRFGTISIRQLVQLAIRQNSTTYLNELIWREFYMMILWHYPHVVHRAFKPKYDHIPWRDNAEEFRKWCEGRTGYPLVDAGMRELKETGFMHNRVRMVTASFLTKHLLIDWRKGEAWFAKHLLDFELASNNGGWQWAAGTGCDAAPYFRIFNPETQMKKFDKQLLYVKKWIPEFGTDAYPSPMVDHKLARERALHTYKTALNAVS